MKCKWIRKEVTNDYVKRQIHRQTPDNVKSFKYSESCYDWFGCIWESVRLSSSNTLFQWSCQYDVRWLPWLLIKVSALQLHHSPPPVWPCPSNKKNTLWSRYVTSAIPNHWIYFLCPSHEEAATKQVDLLVKPQTTRPVSPASFEQTQAWS